MKMLSLDYWTSQGIPPCYLLLVILLRVATGTNDIFCGNDNGASCQDFWKLQVPPTTHLNVIHCPGGNMLSHIIDLPCARTLHTLGLDF